MKVNHISYHLFIFDKIEFVHPLKFDIMSLTYHIRIKKDYAASLIEDLQKMNAIELITENEVPQWQIDEVNQRIKKYENKPELLLDEDVVFKILDAE